MRHTGHARSAPLQPSEAVHPGGFDTQSELAAPRCPPPDQTSPFPSFRPPRPVRPPPLPALPVRPSPFPSFSSAPPFPSTQAPSAQALPSAQAPSRPPEPLPLLPTVLIRPAVPVRSRPSPQPFPPGLAVVLTPRPNRDKVKVSRIGPGHLHIVPAAGSHGSGQPQTPEAHVMPATSGVPLAVATRAQVRSRSTRASSSGRLLGIM